MGVMAMFNSKFKRALSVLFAVILALSLMAPAFAEETAPCTVTQGCTLPLGHAGACVLAESAPAVSPAPSVSPSPAVSPEPAASPGPTVSPEPAESPALCSKVPGCTLPEGHEGACVPVISILPSENTLPADSASVFVSASGSDESGDGSREAPFASLAKAAAYINAAAGDTFTVYVMSDLVSTACARFYDRNVSITSDGGPWTVSRGENFSLQQDNARGTYNPAMLEIGNTADVSTGLMLTNIVFDDRGLKMGSLFEQARSPGEGVDNTQYVQDAIAASYATFPCKITLGSGAVLKNFGGMSSVRVTGAAEFEMKGGRICDDAGLSCDRLAGAAAGAVWCQGGSVSVGVGSLIDNVTGRAIYMDGGTAAIDGQIRNITGAGAAWQGTAGTALHLRNSAQARLTANCRIDGDAVVSGGGSGVFVDSGCTLTVDSGAVIKNLPSGTAGISGSGSVDFDGEITGLKGGANAINMQNAYRCTIGPNGNIHHNNVTYGSIYVQGDGTLDIYGKINYNYSSDRAGGVCLAHNIGYNTASMYEGAEIVGNVSAQTGGGLMVSRGEFKMLGGVIKDNLAKQEGGGVFVRNGGRFIMSGGIVGGNSSGSFGGGLAFQATDWGSPAVAPFVQLNAGAIQNNRMNASVRLDGLSSSVQNGVSNDLALNKSGDGSMDRYLYISSAFTLGSARVYMAEDEKTVLPASGSLDLRLGNAAYGSYDKLEDYGDKLDWSKPYASFWVQRAGGAELTVGRSFDASLPVYALALATGADGLPAAGASIEVHPAKMGSQTGDVNFTLPGSENGYAVALVQPRADYGSLGITAPERLAEQPAASSYHVPFSASYTMAQGLLNALIQSASGGSNVSAALSFTVALDSRLAVSADKADYSLSSPIFDIDTLTISGSTLTVNLKLKSGWLLDAAKLLSSTPTVLSGTGTLAAEDFKAGESLVTNGSVQGSIQAGGDPTEVFVPGNTCYTLMVPASEVTLSYNANGGSGDPPPAQSAYIKETGSADFTIPESRLTAPAPSYSLLGWSRTADGAAEFKAGDTISIQADTELFAVWGELPVQTFTLSFDANGGQNAPAAQSVETTSDSGIVTITKNQPSRDGYVFQGWSQTRRGDVQFRGGDRVLLRGNVTLYAVWVLSTGTPQTGDPGSGALWLGFMCAALPAAGACAAAIKKKKAVQ